MFIGYPIAILTLAMCARLLYKKRPNLQYVSTIAVALSFLAVFGVLLLLRFLLPHNPNAIGVTWFALPIESVTIELSAGSVLFLMVTIVSIFVVSIKEYRIEHSKPSCKEKRQARMSQINT